MPRNGLDYIQRYVRKANLDETAAVSDAACGHDQPAAVYGRHNNQPAACANPLLLLSASRLGLAALPWTVLSHGPPSVNEGAGSRTAFGGGRRLNPRGGDGTGFAGDRVSVGRGVVSPVPEGPLLVLRYRGGKDRVPEGPFLVLR